MFGTTCQTLPHNLDGPMDVVVFTGHFWWYCLNANPDRPAAKEQGGLLKTGQTAVHSRANARSNDA